MHVNFRLVHKFIFLLLFILFICFLFILYIVLILIIFFYILFSSHRTHLCVQEVVEEMKGLLYDREREAEEMRRENGTLASERNNLDEQFTHVLRKMKRLEKENNEMRDSYLYI